MATSNAVERAVLPSALVLTVLTGFTGLVYEVGWQKYLAILLGSHAEATATVLGIFLGGLAAGYALFGWLTRRVVERAQTRDEPPRLLYIYALVEAGIGLYALLFPWTFTLAQKFSLLGPTGTGTAFAFDVGLSALLLGPPTVLMGGTIPILTLALAGNLDRATRVHAWVYGTNTAGAFAGALAGGFVLIPMLGLDSVMWAMAGLNLVAAAGFWQLGRRHRELAPAPSPLGQKVAQLGSWAIVALLAGFAMMTLQTILNRIGGLAFGSSQFTFAMVVAVFVLCIALGSLCVSAFDRIPRGFVVGSQWLLVFLLFPLYFVLGDAPYWAHVIRVIFRPIEFAFYGYQVAIFIGLLLLFAVPIGLSGALLPLLFHELRREVRDLGSVAGRLYAWNTIGSLLGALVGGYLLFFWLDLHQIYRLAMGALAVGASLLTLLVFRPLPRLVSVLTLLPALGMIWLLPAWSDGHLASGLFRTRDPMRHSFHGPSKMFESRGRGDLIFYEDGPTSSVAVVETEGVPETRSIIVNGKPDGSLEGDYPTMALSALIPALLAKQYETAFVIGWGTGVTTGELAALDENRSVRVAEISRAVIAAAPLFDIGNGEASKSPKVEIVRGDAYRTLLRSERKFDLIVSEPSNPWVTGVEMLYSREFLQAAREHLAPGGVYAQWFHVYESDVDVVSLVLRTYADVFPHVSVWFALGADLLLIGFDQPDRALDVAALEERFAQPDFTAGFGRVGIETFPQLLAHELVPLGTLHAGELEGEIQTLRHPILSYRAAWAFFLGRRSWLPSLASPAQRELSLRNSLLHRYAAGGGVLPERVLEAATYELCRFRRTEECATLFARWQLDRPGSPRLERALEKARRANRASRQGLTPRTLRQLQMLYEGKIPDVAEHALAQRAERMTKTFLLHYHHAAPFDRRTIEAAWRRCRGDDCEERQREAWQRMSNLDGEAPVLSESAAPRERRRIGPAWDAEEEDAAEEYDQDFDGSEETE
ncbi:MAG: fused MFS/spermidine synthase [Deltaproteobacteria bacterium]|nr:fused MFS/spermidine synthase [Deltaproteobacteria bacterium]MBW2398149.1 fused MFS/spermidine synthase [Deltaproteobacteria bacterium]